jgi:hypothetical protein
MTPSQLEHLKRIDAHLERLLDIASKRTPGEWKFTYEGIYNRGASFPDIIDPGEFAASDAEVSIEDATFISSCVGNAEAGWRATRVAIAGLLTIAQYQLDGVVVADESFLGRTARHTLESILAAFPLETLIP